MAWQCHFAAVTATFSACRYGYCVFKVVDRIKLPHIQIQPMYEKNNTWKSLGNLAHLTESILTNCLYIDKYTIYSRDILYL